MVELKTAFDSRTTDNFSHNFIMAPPEKTFPVSELEDRIHLHSVQYREKSRKLPKDFDLKRDCELYEMVQYSCTTQGEMDERAFLNPGAPIRRDCYPFVRLFRRCKYGNQEFNVETTALEGRHKWKPSKRLLEERAKELEREQLEAKSKEKQDSGFAQYGDFFWSGK